MDSVRNSATGSQSALLQVLSSLPQLRQQLQLPKYSYLVKFLDTKKKSDFMVRVWYDVEELFTSLSSLRLKLMDHFPNELAAITCTNFKLGYFEPPGNAKCWLIEQRDLQEMYKSFFNGARITLWCERLGSDPNDEAPAQKKPRAPTPREKAEDELDEMFQQLKDKHPGMWKAKSSHCYYLLGFIMYFMYSL